MESVIRNPAEGIYPAGPDYAHAIELRGARRLLLVSGTMGLDPGGAPGATLREQLELAWSNLRTILASAAMTVDDVVRVTSYLRDAAYAEENARARVAALGGRVVPTTAVVVATLEPGWLVELEIWAADEPSPRVHADRLRGGDGRHRLEDVAQVDHQRAVGGPRGGAVAARHRLQVGAHARNAVGVGGAHRAPARPSMPIHASRKPGSQWATAPARPIVRAMLRVSATACSRPASTSPRSAVSATRRAASRRGLSRPLSRARRTSAHASSIAWSSSRVRSTQCPGSGASRHSRSSGTCRRGARRAGRRGRRSGARRRGRAAAARPRR